MTSNSDSIGGYECIWSDLKDHPKCPHGPMLLFGRYSAAESKKFYACSACRDRKLCKYYLDYDTKQTKQQKQTWEQEKKGILPRYDHQKMFIRYNEMLSENPSRRIYCHDCSRLSFVSEKHKHRGHDVLENLTDRQMSHPTEILKPLDNPKKEAQYLFSERSTKTIVDLLLALGAENILCIGAPRIHEYLMNNYDDKISTFLLDIDGRFHNFFGPLNFSWYNLFNNHFFNDDSEAVFKDFLTQNGGKNTYVICDPPFGGRVEPISQTLKTIRDLHKKLNKIETENECLKTLFIFPYFMESILKEKSNPPGVSGGLKELKMSDYKVDYENHPLFAKSLERKIGSPVRIFTDIELDLLKLPEDEGYKYCKRCKKWTSAENKHCKKCKECTSKDGRRYRHCNACDRCVKPTWKHCKKCYRCALDNHKCGESFKITGYCYKCKEFGHVDKFCASNNDRDSHISDEDDEEPSKNNKRKNQENTELSDSPKKARIEGNEKSSKPTIAMRKKKFKKEKSTGVIRSEKIKLKSQNFVESRATIIDPPKEKKRNLLKNETKKTVRIQNGDDIVETKNKINTISKSKSADSIGGTKNDLKIKKIAAKKSFAKNLLSSSKNKKKIKLIKS